MYEKIIVIAYIILTIILYWCMIQSAIKSVPSRQCAYKSGRRRCFELSHDMYCDYHKRRIQ